MTRSGFPSTAVPSEACPTVWRNEALAPKPKVVHGDDLLYRFLLDLFSDDDAAYGHVPQLMLVSMGVWLPLDAYAQFPVILPWVVRDPTCRAGTGRPDQWGAPDPQGYFRDDNSLVKALPRSLAIRASRQPHLNGRRMATEFVAAHVWRNCTDAGPLASRRPLLNSFVPNLVWLPGQVAKLTDREGGLVQRTLQSISWQVYRSAAVRSDLKPIVEDAWALLPEPAPLPRPVDPELLNWFVTNERFLAMRRVRLDSVRHALDDIAAGRPLDSKVVSRRYTDGLPDVTAEARDSLARHLERFTSHRSESTEPPS